MAKLHLSVSVWGIRQSGGLDSSAFWKAVLTKKLFLLGKLFIFNIKTISFSTLFVSL